MTNKVEQFVDALGADKMADAKEAFQAAIAAKIADKFEAKKIELAAGITESVTKGREVRIKNPRRYNALAKGEVTGKVVGMMNKSTVMVKVGTGQYNVDISDIEYLNEAKMEDSEVLSAAKKLAQNGKDEKAKSFGKGLVDYYEKNKSFTPNQVSGLQNIMKNASFQLAKEEK